MDYEKKILVCPSDTDSYNIIHHPQYLIWSEEAILEWLFSNFDSLDNLDYQISNFQCKFLSPGLLYDRLVLKLINKREKLIDGYRTFKFHIRITKEKSNTLVVEADFFVKVEEQRNDKI